MTQSRFLEADGELKKSPPQDFIRMSLGLLKNGRNLPPNQTNTIGSIISLLLQLGLLKIGAWEMEWSWWWCHEDRERFFQVLEFPTDEIFCLATLDIQNCDKAGS